MWKIRKIIFIILFLFIGILSIVLFFKYQSNKNHANKNHRKFNVILIVIDSLRPDHLGCYGYKRNTSPNIDKLAKEGVKFTQAITQAPGTGFSVCSFLTSSYPYMHPITNGRFYLNPNDYSLIRILKENGYVTGLFSDYPVPFKIRIPGINIDFDTYMITNCNPIEISQSTVKWFKKNQNKKFFLWLYYFGPHTPYRSFPPYSDIFLNDGLSKKNKQIPIATGDDKIFGVIPECVAENNITDIDYYIAKYDGMIRAVDSSIGQVLEELKKLDLDKETLVILMSDHGEGLGEHGVFFRHGYVLYDEMLIVPLIFRLPGFIPKNRIIDHQIQLIDIVPTIIDILNIDKEYLKKVKNIEGISLKPYMLGKKHCIQPYAFSSALGSTSVRTGDWKLIYTNFKRIREKQPSLCKQFEGYYLNEYKLYSLKNDPQETKNLINEEKEVFYSLKQGLNEYIIKAKQVKEYQKKYLINNVTESLNEETKAELRSLGYIQ